MGKVKDKILGDAAEKVRQIEEDYLRKGETMRAVYEEGLKNSAMENERILALLYESEIKRLLGIRRLELRKKILSARREMLQRLAETVKNKILKDSVLYRKFIEKAICNGVKSGTEEILISQNDRHIFTDEFLQHLNRIAAEKIGFECSFRIADDYAVIDGGLILANGRENFNAAVSVSVDSLADELEPEIAEMLFGDDN